MTRQPNILVIIADQLAWRALPAYGNTIARTPNIDRIAEKAVRFTECYTPCPLCQPARAAFWTSRYPHETGVLSNGRRHYVPTVPETMPTLGELFASAGYAATHFGKQHDAGGLRGFKNEPMGELPVAAESAWPVNYDTLQDRYATSKTVEWLYSYDGSAPYLTIADLQNPHDICSWVGENAGTHTDVSIDGPLPPLPSNFEDTDLDQRPRPVQYICCSHNRLSQAAPWTEENYRHYLAAYYHYLSRVDAEIGLILDALETRGDAENMPFLVAGPSHLVAGRHTIDAPICLLDLVPTLCDLGGIELRDRFRGRSLRPWLEGTPTEAPHPYVASEWHTEWGFTISPGRMIRTPRYKYTHYLEGDGEELYDLVNDPGETRTLIHDPDHAAALDAHRDLLAEHLAITQDPFLSLAWEAAPRWRNHTPGYQNHRGPAAPMVGS